MRYDEISFVSPILNVISLFAGFGYKAIVFKKASPVESSSPILISVISLLLNSPPSIITSALSVVKV